MSVETSTERTSAGMPAPRTPPRVARLRPKLSVMDLLLQLWRAKWLMLLVFMSIFLIGLVVTMIMPTRYTANTRLLVRPGPEFGQAAPGILLQQEAVMQTEAELARSPEVAQRVIGGVGVARLYPNLVQAKLRARDRGVYVVDQEALDALANDLDVGSSPKSSLLRIAYTHEDRALAAATLNRVVTEYLEYRQEVLSGKGGAGLTEQRDVIEGRLAEADRALRDFLTLNSLSDFDAETAAARKQFADISDELAKVQVSLRESGISSRSSASVRALTVRSAALVTQKQGAEARITHLGTLESDYMRLKRDRDALQASAEAFAAREQTERARNELAALNAGNVSVYEAARTPT
ncbi:MAG TPA: Wzz/FepE/Etk N-terminal domain-containing protein, partial [Verrucomicrobiae bacterium]|nr:Wzz/FepE/Etk N-terminal domain-containing protein [Verrucomicrobiae bacterium]